MTRKLKQLFMIQWYSLGGKTNELILLDTHQRGAEMGREISRMRRGVKGRSSPNLATRFSISLRNSCTRLPERSVRPYGHRDCHVTEESLDKTQITWIEVTATVRKYGERARETFGGVEPVIFLFIADPLCDSRQFGEEQSRARGQSVLHR
jgi:hypothetical protein